MLFYIYINLGFYAGMFNFMTCVAYFDNYRKERIKNRNMFFSLVVLTISTYLWPFIIPTIYFATEKYKYGFQPWSYK